MNLEILPQLLVNAIIAGSIYALASSGLALTYGLVRVLNFAHGHLLMVGAYAMYLFYEEHQLGLLPASALTILVVVALAWASLRIFVLPFLAFNTLLTLVSTLSLANVLEAVVSIQFGVNVKSFSVGASLQSLEIAGVYITWIQIGIILSAFVLLGFVGLVLQFLPIGRQIRALSENPSFGQTLGIDAQRVRIGVFTVGTLLAAFAGVMIGLETNLQPTMGAAYTIKAFAAMILGGLGNLWGTIAGSFILALVENLAIGLDFWGYSLPAGYKDAFAFVAILLILLLRPDGLFRKKQRSV